MDNYYDTAQRMYRSSKTLHADNDFHNACYLAGYIVECYAKILTGLSYGFNHTVIAKEFGHDLKELNKELNYLLMHSALSSYIVDMKIEFPNILLGVNRWNPIKRYSESTLVWDSAISLKFQKEVELAIEKLVKMNLDGHNLI